MSKFYSVEGVDWPDLNAWIKIERHQTRASMESLEYFTDWPKTLGEGVFCGTEMYCTNQVLETEDFGIVPRRYMVIVNLASDRPDIDKVNAYIERQEGYQYLVPELNGGQARFVGAIIRQKKMKLIFIIFDPLIEETICSIETVEYYRRRLN